jgi:hypothetical protein
MATEAQYYSMYSCNGLCRPLLGYRHGDKSRQLARNQPCLGGSGLAEPGERGKGLRDVLMLSHELSTPVPRGR